MIVNTADMHDDEWRSTIPAAEAATEVGAEQDTVGDGGMFKGVLIAISPPLALVLIAYIVARVMS